MKKTTHNLFAFFTALALLAVSIIPIRAESAVQKALGAVTGVTAVQAEETATIKAEGDWGTVHWTIDSIQ